MGKTIVHSFRIATGMAAVGSILVGAAACGTDTSSDEASESTSDAGGGSGEQPCGADPGVVSAAQEEGEVVLFGGGHTREGAELVSELFEETFDIPVTVNRQPTGDIVQQVEASLEAGSVSADVVSAADATPFLRWAEQDIIVDADVPNLDEFQLEAPEERPSFPYAITPLGVSYNSSSMDPADAPTTWDELADELEGKVFAHADVSTSGTALSFMDMVAQANGDTYYDQFADQDVFVTESALALNQLVLTGEADYGAPAIESEIERAKADGEPIEMVYVEDGLPVLNSEIAVLADAPHPNAAKLLAQFHVCETYQGEMPDVGARPILEGLRTGDLLDISDHEIFTVDVAEMESRRDALIDQFETVAR